MKLIIDIPKEDYDIMKKVDTKYEINYFKWLFANLVQNGTPLDDVKAKISYIETYERDGCWVKADVWKILDNIGKAESEE